MWTGPTVRGRSDVGRITEVTESRTTGVPETYTTSRTTLTETEVGCDTRGRVRVPKGSLGDVTKRARLLPETRTGSDRQGE